MPWKECDVMSLREEFVVMASKEGANLSSLCERFGISRKSGYKWLKRYRESGSEGLRNKSRRPHRSPHRTIEDIELKVVAVRDEHPAWGGRKIRARLKNLGIKDVPAASTVTEILHRHDRIAEMESAKHRAFQRFEHAAANDVWQMDFKGHVALRLEGRCHPLTILDDHSRFAIGLRACGNERTETVQAELIKVFRRYGLPKSMLTDNGPPWGSSGYESLTPLALWLMRLRIQVRHGRPCHPQTQGKDERFHRTLALEVLNRQLFDDLSECQKRFDPWRDVYNQERPHEAIGLAVPASRYSVSPISYPEHLPEIEYPSTDTIRQVSTGGYIRFRGKEHQISTSLRGLPVSIRPTTSDGVWDVYFCGQRVRQIDETGGRDRS
jgi:transposase InsO family protein